MDEVILLLVEDDPLVMCLSTDALEAGGFKVIQARDGCAAITMSDDKASCISGLITDVGLGHGLTGWEIAAHARERFPQMPVIYATGGNSSDWPVYGVPMSVLVEKPYAARQLLTAITELLSA